MFLIDTFQKFVFVWRVETSTYFFVMLPFFFFRFSSGIAIFKPSPYLSVWDSEAWNVLLFHLLAIVSSTACLLPKPCGIYTKSRIEIKCIN